jgi:chemotaxis protein methyltransferase CheR
MLLEEQGLLDKVEIVASDLSEAALGRARAGVYSVRALRQQPNHPLAARYLERSNDNLLAAPKLLGAIDYRCLNLMDEAAVAGLGMFDLIVCRNVLIYFRDARASKLIQCLAKQLTSRGALLVGAAESLMRFGSELVCEEQGGAFLYVKQAP